MRKLLSRDKYNKSAESYKIDYQIFEKKGEGVIWAQASQKFQYVDTYTGKYMWWSQWVRQGLMLKTAEVCSQWLWLMYSVSF